MTYEQIRLLDGLIMLICLIQSMKHYHRQHFLKAIYFLLIVLIFLLIVLIAALPAK